MLKAINTNYSANEIFRQGLVFSTGEKITSIPGIRISGWLKTINKLQAMEHIH